MVQPVYGDESWFEILNGIVNWEKWSYLEYNIKINFWEAGCEHSPLSNVWVHCNWIQIPQKNMNLKSNFYFTWITWIGQQVSMSE
jgi:hypothetical protein